MRFASLVLLTCLLVSCLIDSTFSHKHISKKQRTNKRLHFRTRNHSKRIRKSSSNSYKQQCLMQHNNYRRSQGSGSLKWDKNLALSSKQHSASQARQRSFNHARGTNVRENLYAASYQINGCGDAVGSWTYSPPHAANMRYRGNTRVGCGSSTMYGRTVVTCRMLIIYSSYSRLCIAE